MQLFFVSKKKKNEIKKTSAGGGFLLIFFPLPKKDVHLRWLRLMKLLLLLL